MGDGLAQRHRGELTRLVTYVESDGEHSHFVRLRVKVSRLAADRIDAYCRQNGLHLMAFYRETFDTALEGLMVDLSVAAVDDSLGF
jgi:hypothetical protein